MALTQNKNKSVSGDLLWSQEFYGTDGDSPVLAAQIRVYADGTVGAAIVPGRFELWTASSAGTLTKALTLDSSQALTLVGAAVNAVMALIPTATVAATGSDQAGAAAIATGFTLVTGANDALGVRLPTAAAGKICIIKVGPGADLVVYPATGDAINKATANDPITVVDDVCFMLIAYDATDWYTLPLLPS